MDKVEKIAEYEEEGVVIQINTKANTDVNKCK